MFGAGRGTTYGVAIIHPQDLAAAVGRPDAKNRRFRTGLGQMAIGAVTMSGAAKMAQTVFDFGWG